LYHGQIGGLLGIQPTGEMQQLWCWLCLSPRSKYAPARKPYRSGFGACWMPQFNSENGKLSPQLRWGGVLISQDGYPFDSPDPKRRT